MREAAHLRELAAREPFSAPTGVSTGFADSFTHMLALQNSSSVSNCHTHAHTHMNIHTHMNTHTHT